MITRSKWANEYKEGYFALAIDSYKYNYGTSMWKEICDVKTSKKAKEENIERGGTGDPVVKGEGEPITYTSATAGSVQTWIPLVFALALRISEEAVDDNLYELNGGGGDKLSELFKDLGISMSNNEEVLMARFLVNGAATTYHTTRNGNALFATDHPRINGSTFSNKATSTDLTYTSLWTNVVAAENQYDNNQKKIFKKVKNLWVAPQQERQAIEALKSTDRPDTANRATNAMIKSGRSIGIKVWNQLTDTDAHYFQLDGKGILRHNLRKTRFASETDFQTGDLMVKADQRWSAEIDDPQGWYGNIPA